MDSFEVVKKFKWYELEKKNIFSCLIGSGSEAIGILMNDKEGVKIILDKLQQQILNSQSYFNVQMCNDITSNVVSVTKTLTTRAILQPNTIDGFPGLCGDLEAPFIRVCKYLLSLTFYLKYLQSEAKHFTGAITSLKESIDALVHTIYTLLDSNDVIKSLLDLVTTFEVSSFSLYIKECLNFNDQATKDKAVFTVDSLIFHAAQRTMSPSQRVGVFRTLLLLCKDESICKEIQCLSDSRKNMTLIGLLTGDVILPSMREARNMKSVIDDCGPLIDKLVSLIREEGLCAAASVEEVVSTRPVAVLKKLFKIKTELFAVLIEHNKSLESFKSLLDMKESTGSFSGEGYLTALNKCPLKWKNFFDEISSDLFSEMFEKSISPGEEEQAKKQIIQVLAIFSAYQPDAPDKTLYNSLVKLEETIKGKAMMLTIHLPNALKNYRIGEYNPSKLIYFKTFTDILFFKSSTNILQLLQKGRTLAGTAGYTQTIAQYQSIWTSFSSVSAIFFEHLKDLWFRVLTQITGLMRIDNVSKKNFEEFVVYFNSILNSYQMAGVNFWSSILAQSLKHVGKKQSLKKIIQGIVVRNF
jgi:hypothetical protein